MNEKTQFADRLRAAMIAAGYEARPSVLEKHFNARYWGRSVTYQAARRWLIGLSIPEQEKLQVIADWLGIEPHVLRYGRPGSGRSHRDAESRSFWMAQLDPTDRAAINAYLALPKPMRQHLHAVLAACASGLGGGAAIKEGRGQP